MYNVQNQTLEIYMNEIKIHFDIYLQKSRKYDKICGTRKPRTVMENVKFDQDILSTT